MYSHARTHIVTHPPLFLAYSTASSMSLAYSGFCDACRMSDGFVVASLGLYFFMADQSKKVLPITLSTIERDSGARDTHTNSVSGNLIGEYSLNTHLFGHKRPQYRHYYSTVSCAISHFLLSVVLHVKNSIIYIHSCQNRKFDHVSVECSSILTDKMKNKKSWNLFHKHHSTK